MESDMRQFRSLCLVALVISVPAAAGGKASLAEAQSSASSDNPLAAWPLDFFADTRNRPLFSPRRRPPPPAAPPPPQIAAPTPKIPPPNIALLAIVSDGDVAQAVVRTGEAEKAIRARLGDDIAGWKVTQIEPRRLVLSSDDRSVSFALFAGVGRQGTTGGGGAPAAPNFQMQNLAQESCKGSSRRRYC
jgi:general secretion pathway protein N